MRRLYGMAMLVLCVLLAMTATAVQAAGKAKKAPPPATTPAEAELGKKTAEEIEKQFKLVDDPAAIARLQTIADTLAPVTERPQVTYTLKILDTPALNAMAIPGGIIYVTKGLLSAVESDHELAGVLAHEIAHNALLHAKKLMERDKQYSLLHIATVVAVLYSATQTKDPSSLPLASMSGIIKQALLNGYTVELERQADANAVEYLVQSKTYDPVGLYSVILGFEQMEKHRPQTEFGYQKTHPGAEDRKTSLLRDFTKRGIAINLWNVVNFHAEVQPPVDGTPGYTVVLGSEAIVTFTETLDGMDAQARATDAADAINRRLRKLEIQQFDVEQEGAEGRHTIRLRRVPVFTLTEADAAAAGKTLFAYAETTVANIKAAIFNENVKRRG